MLSSMTDTSFLAQDKSDEVDCSTVVTGDSYQNYIPPPSLPTYSKFDVELRVELLSVQKIVEIESIFQVQNKRYLDGV